MTQMLRRQQRKIAAALLLLNVSGARAIAVSDSCDHCRVFYSASLSFKAVTKTVTRQAWKRPAPQTLGQDRLRFCTKDLEAVGAKAAVALIPVMPAAALPLDSRSSRAVPAGRFLPSTDPPAGRTFHRLI